LRGRQDLVKQDVIFICFASICKSLYTLYGAITVSILPTFQEPIHEVVSVKRNYQGRYPSSGDPSFRTPALAGTSAQQHQNLHLLVHSGLSAVQCPHGVNSSAWELRTLKTSDSSKFGNHCPEGCMNPQMRRVCYT
jgi:hypothetical protein